MKVLKLCFDIPRHILGYVLLWLGMGLGYVAHGTCFVAAYLLDEEEFWREDARRVDEHFKDIFSEDDE